MTYQRHQRLSFLGTRDYHHDLAKQREKLLSNASLIVTPAPVGLYPPEYFNSSVTFPDGSLKTGDLTNLLALDRCNERQPPSLVLCKRAVSAAVLRRVQPIKVLQATDSQSPYTVLDASNIMLMAAMDSGIVSRKASSLTPLYLELPCLSPTLYSEVSQTLLGDHTQLCFLGRSFTKQLTCKPAGATCM